MNPPIFKLITNNDLLTIVNYLVEDPNFLKPFQSRLKEAQYQDLMNKFDIPFEEPPPLPGLKKVHHLHLVILTVLREVEVLEDIVIDIFKFSLSISIDIDRKF
jgi:hypothetical protein